MPFTETRWPEQSATWMQERSSRLVNVQNEATTELFEDILHKGISLRVRVTGQSMRPFIRTGDIVVMRQVPAYALQIGDVVFFKSRGERALLHRLIKKESTSGGLQMFARGDARQACDPPVLASEVLAKVVMLEKLSTSENSVRINMEAPYWRVVNYMCATLPWGRMRSVGNQLARSLIAIFPAKPKACLLPD